MYLYMYSTVHLDVHVGFYIVLYGASYSTDRPSSCPARTGTSLLLVCFARAQYGFSISGKSYEKPYPGLIILAGEAAANRSSLTCAPRLPQHAVLPPLSVPPSRIWTSLVIKTAVSRRHSP